MYALRHKYASLSIAAGVSLFELSRLMGTCARCGELIEVGSKWHLDHRDDGHGWLGPSHESCNARAGLEKMLTGLNGNGAFREEHPGRWSRRWYNDPPVGTEVFLGNGLVEIHVGRGVWAQTVAAESSRLATRGS